MKTKIIQVVLSGFIMTLICSSGALAGERYKGQPQLRMDRHSQRIERGCQNGEITRKEYRSLNREQQRIYRTYNRFSSDGRLDRREQRCLDNMQDRASRHIKQAKHRNHSRYKSGHRGHHHHGLESRNHNRYHPKYYQRRQVVHNHYEQNYYNSYPAETESTEDFVTSVGLSDTDWEITVSTRGNW